MESAIKSCCESVDTKGIEKVELKNAISRVCAENVVAQTDVPGFKRSFVDGYALTQEDVEKGIFALKLAAVIPAGYADKITLQPGECARIMTGAPIPEGVAAVIKQEEVENRNNLIVLQRTVAMGENIQNRDSVYKKGQIIVSKGEELDPLRIEALATTGVTEIPVYYLPHIYLINTGSETVMPGEHLANGHIYQSNNSLLTAKVLCAGCGVPSENGITKDDISLITKEVKNGLESAELTIVTGGTSYGDYDLVLPALEENHVELLFTNIPIRPGRNVTAGVKDGRLIINLPGNPGAVNILFDALITPIIRKMKGLNDYRNKWINIKLAQTIGKRGSQRTLMRAELIEDQSQLFARPLRKNEYFNGLKPMLLDIQPGQGMKGDIVKGLILG